MAFDDVRFAERGGIHVAYREVIGDPDSDVTVLLCSGQFIPIELMWDDRVHAKFLDGLASLGRLLVYDRYGIGLSDPVEDWDDPLQNHWPADVVAVLDDAGIESAYVVGWELGTGTAFRVAARWPERVKGLVVMHGTDTAERAARRFGFPLDAMSEGMVAWVESHEHDPPFALTNPYYPSRDGDASLIAWLDSAGRRGASPSTAAKLWRAILTPGRHLDLSTVTPRTMMLFRRDVSGAGDAPGGALEMVAEMPDAHYVELPGADLAPYSGDVDEILAEIHRFITGVAGSTHSSDREIAAVLFSDIVESTDTLAHLGDGAWRGTLDAHDEIANQVLVRTGGRLVAHTGDGLLAEFGLASRAVAAARGLRDKLGDIGISTRIGVHVGEIERRGDNIAGAAVHVAARLMSHADSGSIVTSAAVPLVSGIDAGNFTTGPTVELKGLPGTWETFRVT
ncbi:MAG: adenylate/guanylate cyclase domain-containing protein [Microthrixaceae bacterium]